MILFIRISYHVNDSFDTTELQLGILHNIIIFNYFLWWQGERAWYKNICFLRSLNVERNFCKALFG